MNAQRHIGILFPDPVQQRRLKDKILDEAGVNTVVIVGFSEPALRFSNGCRGEAAFVQPGISHCGNRGIEEAIGVVKRMERKNVPPCNCCGGSHAVPYGGQRINFIQPTQGDVLRRHEAMQSGNHDGGRTRESCRALPSIERAKPTHLPTQPAAGGHWNRISACCPRLSLLFMSID
ncbi:MAG: hypothetical protein DMG14_11635 [Acidobacteria bacterium]|nr:MAG: hypothetical protein DMG14_11635 [Acidobacteriota bacterium]